eukprot:TRINITY_DN5415_c0_g1_i1.p1 TRINITY_DN5415_c0_g1~~TRINITY_DN5415_c0_g1_i1.p1  ORF type:complete len:691 (-),score=103.47 TRINITY_DN5415_c0_g1_i1:19-2091(-)
MFSSEIAKSPARRKLFSDEDDDIKPTIKVIDDTFPSTRRLQELSLNDPETDTPPVPRKINDCPPTPTRPRSVSRSPMPKINSIASLGLPVPKLQTIESMVVNTEEPESPRMSMPSLAVPNITVAIASPQKPSKSTQLTPRDIPSSPLRVLHYKTNLNPFSPQRDHPKAGREISIPTESAAGPIPRMISDFEVHSELGRGSFGSVQLCLNRTDGWTYAVKKLLYQSNKMREKFLQEAYGLAALGQHQHIVRYYSSWEDPSISAIYIQCEWCQGGSLRKQQRENPSLLLKQSELSRILSHIGKGLNYMHSKGFSHGDVKPDNILLSTPTIEATTIYKLSDLGQINDAGDGKYLAPEVLAFEDEISNLKHNVLEKADIFSLGITIYEIAYELSYKKFLGYESRSQITQEDIALPQELFQSEFVDLLKKMLLRDYTLRPTAEQILSHHLIGEDLEFQVQRSRDTISKLEKQIEELHQELRKSKNKSTKGSPASKRKRQMLKDKNQFLFTMKGVSPQRDCPPKDMSSPFASVDMNRLSPPVSGKFASPPIVSDQMSTPSRDGPNFKHHSRSAFIPAPSPGSIQSPSTMQSPALMMQSPASIQSPSMMQSPASMQSPSMQSPASMQSPSMMQSPASMQSPSMQFSSSMQCSPPFSNMDLNQQCLSPSNINRNSFLAPQTPGFSPGLSFSFSPPSNP